MVKQLTDEQGRKLLALARKTLECRLAGSAEPRLPEDEALTIRAACFVTLKCTGRLRGCIGNLQPVGTLCEGVRDNAISAAFHDHRFSPLHPEELGQVHLDISILSPPRALAYEDPASLLVSLRPGIDGVTIRDGRRSATFLPQVWQQLPTAEVFLSHLCQKAGLPESAWRERKLEIEVYQVQCFAEEMA